MNEFVHQLPVKRIPGVGKVTARKLNEMNIHTCGDLQLLSLADLMDRFGAFGKKLYERSRGIDERPVCTEHRRKSLSVEHTYPADLAKANDCLKKIPQLFMELTQRLRRVDSSYCITKGFVKIKFHDFSITTIERSIDQLHPNHFHYLCEEAFLRGDKPVRLLGMGVRFIDLKEEQRMQQLDLFVAVNS